QHVHGLAHTGTTEQTNLTTLGKRANQVNHLNTGFQQLYGRRQFVESRCRLVNGAALVGLDRTDFVNGATQNVHNATQGANTHGNGDGSARTGHFHTAAQAVAGTHGDGANYTVTQLLLYFKSQAFFCESRTFVNERQCFVDFRDAVAGELNIHHGADALNDGTVAHVESLQDNFDGVPCRDYTAAAPPTISEISFVIAAWRVLL